MWMKFDAGEPLYCQVEIAAVALWVERDTYSLHQHQRLTPVSITTSPSQVTHGIVNGGKWFGSPANIKEANKEAKI